MPTNRYNGAPADTDTIPAGTALYRILKANATYGSNSFNPTPLPRGDKNQGRFEPVHSDMGGYIYVSPTIAGAVAEGILRDKQIRRTGPRRHRLVQRAWLLNKKIALLTLQESVDVAIVHGAAATKLNLDTSLLGAGRERYSETRALGTEILKNTPGALGLRYRCRNNDDLLSLMLIDRRAAQPAIHIDDEHDVLRDRAGRDLVLGSLDRDFGLKYVGLAPSS